MSGLALNEIIERLEAAPKGTMVNPGLCNPHSFRGYYEDLAFEKTDPMPVAEVLALVKSCHGRTFQGYKGGDYTMGDWTTVWLGEYGTSSDADQIGPTLLDYMLGVSP